MKLSNRSLSFPILFAFTGLLSAQNVVPPGTVADPSLLFLGWFIAGIGLLGGGFLIIRSVINGRKSKASLQWPSVPGTVVFSQMVQSGPYGSGYHGSGTSPKVTYSYVVNEEAYQCSKVEFGRGRSKKILAKYPQGNPVQVFFDPQRPSYAVLEKGGSTRAVLFGGIAMIVFTGLTGLFVIWVNR
jgi:hypothetical protein